MKVLTTADTLPVKGVNTAKSPINVCMHTLRSARHDRRAIRAGSTLVEAGFAVSIVDVESEHIQPTEEMKGLFFQHIIIPDWFTARRSEFKFLITSLKTFIRSIVLLFQSQADIYHASELTALPACYLVARLRRKPLIFEAYEYHFPLPDTRVAFWRPLGGLLIHLLTVILPKCAGTIAVSDPIAQEIGKRYHVPEVTVIRNVPVYQRVQKTDRLRSHLGLKQDVRIALFQGNLQPGRGLEKLICAASFLQPDTIIVMMGKDMDNTQSQLEDLIAREGVADQVKIMPAVPYEELLAWTVSADIGLNILPPDYSLSIRWCLPCKLFEYLMAGLPILSSPLEAVAEVIRAYDVGQVVSSLEPADIAQAIQSMLADSPALSRMHHNALKAAQACCWEQESQHLLRLYQKVVTSEKKKGLLHDPNTDF